VSGSFFVPTSANSFPRSLTLNRGAVSETRRETGKDKRRFQIRAGWARCTHCAAGKSLGLEFRNGPAQGGAAEGAVDLDRFHACPHCT
jgi:hypothetical protein